MAKPGYLADTSALARMRHEQVAVQLEPLIAAGEVARCPITDLEALYSAESPRGYERIRTRREAAYPNLSLTASAVRRALEVQRLLARRSQHRGAGLADLLIAAIAEEHGVTVLHYDSDYDLIAAQTGQAFAWVGPRGTVA